MDLIQKYYQEFGLKATYDRELEKFYNRIDNIFKAKDPLVSSSFSDICHELGLKEQEKLINYSFSETLLNLCMENETKLDAYRLLITMFVNKDYIKPATIIEIVNLSQIDLGFRFNEQEKFFYKSGDEILDKACIDDTLENLSSDKALSELYKKSLEKYFHKDTNCIHDAYSVLEKLFQKISQQPEAGVTSTKEKVFKTVNISQNFKSITNSFIDLASNHVRHSSEEGSKKKYPYSFREHQEEIEAAMYLAGILIRLYSGLENKMTVV